MGDMGKVFREMTEDSKLRRGNNRDNALPILDKREISYVSKNGGAHLIVEGRNGMIDFWPGTGKFISRKGLKGRGIMKLIKLC